MGVKPVRLQPVSFHARAGGCVDVCLLVKVISLHDSDDIDVSGLQLRYNSQRV